MKGVNGHILLVESLELLLLKLKKLLRIHQLILLLQSLSILHRIWSHLSGRHELLAQPIAQRVP